MIAMKGKGDQRTFWLHGEDELAREFRTKERTERRGSRALIKANLNGNGQLLGKLGIPSETCPRSSLKNRSLMYPRTSLPRSSSLESPKKLRFASGNLLEHHRYHR